MHRFPHKCPICGEKLTVTEVSCKSCETQIHGKFDGCRFCSLSPEESAFLLTFIRCRGSIKDVERELGVSYPTVRAMLDNLITTLDREEDTQNPQVEVAAPPVSVIDTRTAACTASEVKPRRKNNAADARRAILERLAAHEITAEEAAALLKKL